MDKIVYLYKKETPLGLKYLGQTEDFTLYTTEELFYYLIDNLLISPDEDFKDWRHYKQDMLDIAKNFEKECHDR